MDSNSAGTSLGSSAEDGMVQILEAQGSKSPKTLTQLSQGYSFLWRKGSRNANINEASPLFQIRDKRQRTTKTEVKKMRPS